MPTLDVARSLPSEVAKTAKQGGKHISDPRRRGRYLPLNARPGRVPGRVPILPGRTLGRPGILDAFRRPRVKELAMKGVQWISPVFFVPLLALSAYRSRCWNREEEMPRECSPVRLHWRRSRCSKVNTFARTRTPARVLSPTPHRSRSLRSLNAFFGGSRSSSTEHIQNCSSRAGTDARMDGRASSQTQAMCDGSRRRLTDALKSCPPENGGLPRSHSGATVMAGSTALAEEEKSRSSSKMEKVKERAKRPQPPLTGGSSA